MLRTRILAAATTALLALGMAAGGASPALANGSDAGTPCNSIGYEKPPELDNLPDDSSGSESYEWGTISWDSPDVTVTVNAGYVVGICVKGGNTYPAESGPLTGPTTWNYTHGFGLSHLGFTFDFQPGVATASIDLTDPDCFVGETLNEAGFGGENSDYVVIDYGTEDGTYEVVFTADEGFEFTGGETELRFTGTLAGPSDDPACEEQPGLATAFIDRTEPDCFFGEMLNEEGFGGENSEYVVVDYGTEDGTYEVVFTADEGFEFEGGATELRFIGELLGPIEGEECVLPITDAFIAFTDATCLEPQSLDEEGFEFDSELASLEDVSYDGLDYTVMFVAIGEDTQFFQDSEPVEGREVSEDGKTLTFTGTLEGPNEELCLEVVVPPVTVVDDCFEQSYTITAVEGASYAVSVNGSLPMAVSFEEGEDTATFGADPFDEIVVMATADEGYILAEGYEPFEYTFEFDEECLPTAPVTSASVTFTQADCLGNPGSYTLTNEPGVIWTVDGVVVEGNTKYTAAVGSTPSIVASLEPASEEFPTGFGWSDPDQRTLWNLVFEAAEDCLPTLAITGASNALGGLGVIAILIMMAGTGLVVARRREAVRIQG